MWNSMRIDEVANKLRTNVKIGLAGEQVVKRKDEFGKNKLAEKKKEP